MEYLSAVGIVAALQLSPEEVPYIVAYPPEMATCTLSTVVVGVRPDSPMVNILFFSDGEIIRLERELPANSTVRNLDDLIIQVDDQWYAGGRAFVAQAANNGDAKASTTLQVYFKGFFGETIANAKTITIWEGDKRREQLDLRSFPANSMAEWKDCTAMPPIDQLSNLDVTYYQQLPDLGLEPLGREGWIAPEDYEGNPAAKLEGTVAYKLDISLNGTVKKCSLNDNDPVNAGLVVNNVPALNALTCQILKQYARFSPATDQNGRPIFGTFKGFVTWPVAD